MGLSITFYHGLLDSEYFQYVEDNAYYYICKTQDSDDAIFDDWYREIIRVYKKFPRDGIMSFFIEHGIGITIDRITYDFRNFSVRVFVHISEHDLPANSVIPDPILKGICRVDDFNYPNEHENQDGFIRRGPIKPLVV